MEEEGGMGGRERDGGGRKGSRRGRKEGEEASRRE